jgi:di/tricarboxylate transporter
MHKIMTLAALTAAAALAVSPAMSPATAKTSAERLGTLKCEVEGGVGMIVGSSKKLACTFANSRGRTERYTGSIGKLGLDVGVSGKSYITWVVVTASGTKVGQHALAGSYIGASSGAALGIGLGANALVGGPAKKIGLQPVSIQGNTGVNLALGVSALTLKAAK